MNKYFINGDLVSQEDFLVIARRYLRDVRVVLTWRNRLAWRGGPHRFLYEGPYCQELKDQLKRRIAS